MKKKNYAEFILAFAMILCSYNSLSQGTCETSHYANTASENAFNEYVVSFKAEGRHLNTDLKIIPVVIHVIYRKIGDKLQITRSRIENQIEATNKQLRRLNANANETRAIFLPVVADCNIQVALATRKPDRSRFTGVIYHRYPDFNQGRDLSAVRAATILDPRKYLNVWVLPDTGGGSAIYPWQATATSDGFWIGAEWFGTKGANLSSCMNFGTTFTHELAHYLGVYHTNEGGINFVQQCKLAYNGSVADFCADTPLDWSFPPGIECDIINDGIQTCADESILLAQVENFMYYNPDAYTNMLSEDQRARMRAALFGFGYRRQLCSFLNLLFTGVRWTDLRGNNSYSKISELPDEIIDNDLTPGKSLSKNDITIFPNPAKSNVHITYRNPAIKNMSIKIYNQTGVKLKELHSKTAIYELNLDGLPDGVYYINMTIDNVPVTERIIKTGSGKSFSVQ